MRLGGNVRPNNAGGQTLENGYELCAVASALNAYGDVDRAVKIISSEPTKKLHGNINPIFLEDSQEIVRPLSEEDTEVVMQALKQVATGRLLVANPLDELVAQSMVAKYEDTDFIPRSNRVRKVLTRIGF